MKIAPHLRQLAAAAICFFALRVGAEEVPVSSISLQTALADARALAAQHPNLRVMHIEGVSMLPYFGEGSIVVVKTINAVKLRPGMVAVYKNRFGETVAHRLVGRVDGGWQVKGWNNDRADTTVVNEANLFGVVYATFHSSGEAPQLVSVLRGVPLALAAPAR